MFNWFKKKDKSNQSLIPSSDLKNPMAKIKNPFQIKIEIFGSYDSITSQGWYMVKYRFSRCQFWKVLKRSNVDWPNTAKRDMWYLFPSKREAESFVNSYATEEKLKEFIKEQDNIWQKFLDHEDEEWEEWKRLEEQMLYPNLDDYYEFKRRSKRCQ